MKETITKEILLKAFRRIYSQYKRGVHDLDITRCQLCKLFYDPMSKWSTDCTSCPMTVFRGYQSCKCMNRNCKPIDCNDRYDRDEFPLSYKINVKAVREFYRLAIEKIESIPDEEFQKDIDWLFLIKIDQDVSKKYLE
jgi:hypothetical protein